MAYAALVSLRNTVRFLGKFSRLSSLPICLDTLNYPSDEVGFLEQVIEKLDGRSRSERVDAMDGLIRDALCELEDAVASLFSDLMLIAQSDQTIGTDQIFSVYEQGVNSFLEATKKITEEYYSPEPPEEEDDEDDYDEDKKSSGTDDFGGSKSKFVGFSDVLAKIKHDLITAYRNNELHVVSFVGVAGTGRSAFPWIIFDTGYIARLFKLRAWIRVGPLYQFREILLSIISQIDDDSGHKLLVAERDEKLFEYLYTKLQSGRYMIVLDDVRETQVWKYLRGLFPDENNGSRIFLTTHLHKIAQFANSSCVYPTRPLEKDECWNLLSEVIFGQGNPCPLELENAGKKMAENCEGLLLEVAKVASILCKVEQTPDNWNKVAAEMENSAAIDGIIKKVFLNEYGFPAHVVSVVGMVGIGKTAIAREIFEDPWILQCYDHRVWITLGPKYGKERLFVDFLTQLDPNAGEMLLKDDETSIKHIITSILSHKRCFIVLDDLCHKRNLIALEDFLEDFKCEVLVTTRILGIPLYHTRYYGRHRVHEIPFLNKDESWSLLRQRVFGDEACPHELEKAGKLIAENCDGLPLMIVTVADLLSEADDESPEYWEEVAETRSSVFEDAYQKISKTLYPCYKDLDLELRMSFLYMAAFRRKYDIPVSKLFMLYTAEGINPPGSWDLLNFKIKYFEDFVLKSLVLASQYNGKFKSCRLHSVFWHFCVTEAGNDRFLHVVSCYADGLMEVLENQRRLCIHSNVLFAIKDVYDSIAATSTVHSLLCFGPPHQYQVPICYDLKFLKVVDALTIRLYEFPIGILNLVLLRYLALTYNGKLPASISKLWSLEFLIIHRYMSIKLPGDLSYVPMEIWDMKELKHVQIMGSNLPDIGPNSDAMLEKLRILLDVRAESCTKSILDRIPNLLKLGIQIELTADSSEPSFSFDQISHLEELHSLKCVIVNPDLKPDIVAPPVSFSMLPSGLRKVSLSGFGYPWECMRSIALLPKLQELRLKSYAFRGPEWVIHEGDFRSLYSLQLEDADLVHWRASYCHLQSLEFLTIKHCYKLKKIPWQCLPTSCEIQLVDCNPSASNRMPENYSARVYSSWEGGKTRANEGLPSQSAKFQF